MTAKHNFHVRQGDTFRQRQITLMVDGTPMDLTDAVIEMKIKAKKGGDKIADFNPEIVGEGVINLPFWDVDLKPYTYVYDLQITMNNGYTLTYMEGDFNVTRDV